MSIAWIILLLVAAQRLGELLYSRRNEAQLRDRGGVEIGAGHYPFVFLVHGGWLVTLAVWIALAAPVLNWGWLALFAVLQLGRVWIVVTLGPYWTTRIITVADAPLIKTGPYRWLRHPNYLVVAGEVAVLPLVFSAHGIAITFSILNALLLVHRIRVESTALQDRC
mgnify:FL=1